MGKILFRALALLLISALTLSSYAYGQHRHLLQMDGTDWLKDSDQICAKWLNAGIIVGMMMGTAAADKGTRELIDRINNALYGQRTTSAIELKEKMVDLSLEDITVNQLLAGIDAFYEDDFSALKRYTQPRPEARPLVQSLFDQGYDVVIATNPLFPRRAIEHRLDWAGVSDFDFKLITTYENSHFSKPNPRYYQEILDKIGCRPQDAVMVGDDLQNDIAPALHVGLQAYWIRDGVSDDFSPYLGLQGTLADCLHWVGSGGPRES